MAAITLAMACSGMIAVAQPQAVDAKTTPDIYQTLYLTNLTQQKDAIELVNDLRNMLPNAKLYYVPSQSAFSIRASVEEIALAQKILADLDKTKKIYRLTYTMTERDGGKTIGVQHLGQEIEASLDGYLDGVRLRTKVVQSSIAEDKSGVGTQDPVIRQTTLEGTSTLVQGKPLVLGSLDIPGSTRHQEVEVVSELVR